MADIGRRAAAGALQGLSTGIKRRENELLIDYRADVSEGKQIEKEKRAKADKKAEEQAKQKKKADDFKIAAWMQYASEEVDSKGKRLMTKKRMMDEYGIDVNEVTKAYDKMERKKTMETGGGTEGEEQAKPVPGLLEKEPFDQTLSGVPPSLGGQPPPQPSLQQFLQTGGISPERGAIVAGGQLEEEQKTARELEKSEVLKGFAGEYKGSDTVKSAIKEGKHGKAILKTDSQGREYVDYDTFIADEDKKRTSSQMLALSKENRIRYDKLIENAQIQAEMDASQIDPLGPELYVAEDEYTAVKDEKYSSYEWYDKGQQKKKKERFDTVSKRVSEKIKKFELDNPWFKVGKVPKQIKTGSEAGTWYYEYFATLKTEYVLPPETGLGGMVTQPVPSIKNIPQIKDSLGIR